MKNSIIIRAYHQSDKESIIQLIQLNTPTYFAAKEEEDLKNYLEHERELYFVLFVEQQLVGCGGINFTDNYTTAKISWDIIHPDFQGKSLGSQLLKYRLDKLKAMDSVQKIQVRTSQLAYKFYEKLGFELIEIEKDYWAEGFDLYEMKYRF